MFNSNFTKPTCKNVGSIRSFLFIPEAQVDEMSINEMDNILNSISLIGGAAWLKAYSTVERIGVEEETENTDQGTIYRPVLSGFYPGYNYLIEKIFAQMSPIRFIIDVIDNNGERYVLGRQGNGMHFQWKYTTGNAPRSLQGYTFRFYHESSYPRLRYNLGVAVPVPDVL
jgi:hypothetical protein